MGVQGGSEGGSGGWVHLEGEMRCCFALITYLVSASTDLGVVCGVGAGVRVGNGGGGKGWEMGVGVRDGNGAGSGGGSGVCLS